MLSEIKAAIIQSISGDTRVQVVRRMVVKVADNGDLLEIRQTSKRDIYHVD
jgi:hypothetical protein